MVLGRTMAAPWVIASDSGLRNEKLFLLQRCRSCLGSLGVLLFAEAAISLRQQMQSPDVARIGFGQRLKIGQSSGKIGLLNFRFRQSKLTVAAVRIHQQGCLELVLRFLCVLELQIDLAEL